MIHKQLANLQRHRANLQRQRANLQRQFYNLIIGRARSAPVYVDGKIVVIKWRVGVVN